MRSEAIETYDKLVPIVATIKNIFTPTLVTELSPNNYRIDSCDTLWLTLTYTVLIGAVTYTIVDLEPNVSITVTGASLPAAVPFDIHSPVFLAATSIEQNKEMARIENSKDKLPLIWLHDIVKEKFVKEVDSILERKSQCELYFLIDADFEGWTTAQHRKYAILPMRNLMFNFVDALQESGNIGLLGDYDVQDHARFGVYEDKGHTKRIFSDDLSGSQLSIEIPFQKNLGCGCD